MLIRLLLSCFWSCALAGALALPTVALPPEVSKALRQRGIPENAISLYVREIGSEAPLISHRAYTPMNPASTMKIVTTLAALDVLGPQHSWKTDFLTAAPQQGEVLNGPLVIRGSGDPKFTWEHLQAAVAAIRRAGIREIRGDVWLDRSAFAPAKYDAGAFDGQPQRPHNAPPDALLYNFKSIGFRFSPQANGSVTIGTDGPMPDGLTIVNELKVGNGACGDFRSTLKSSFDSQPNVAKARFFGNYPRECGDRELYVSLFDHTGILAGSFARLWRDAGGKWSGLMREGRAPKNARVLYAHWSTPLASMITEINKFSNNVMARQLLLTFDAQLMESPGRADRGGIAIREWARLRRVEVPELVIENGSGLSRIERISTAGLAKLLEYGLTSTFATDFLKSLPVAAQDGTIARRFANVSAQGNAFLKTGTLTGVIALAGYLRVQGNRPFLFVAMINHPNANGNTEVLDMAVDWVFQNAR
jgi:serine-type D-Ala-D-Ala carboxypeptidase/endopeptidase (penicillin-binding protein 4)